MEYISKIFKWMSQESQSGEKLSSHQTPNNECAKKDSVYSEILESDEDNISYQDSFQPSSASAHNKSSKLSANCNDMDQNRSSPAVNDEIDCNINVSDIATNVANANDNENITASDLGKFFKDNSASLDKDKSSKDLHQLSDENKNIIGYDFGKLILRGENAAKDSDLFVLHSIWRDKKSLKEVTSAYLSLTGRGMASGKTSLNCSRYGQLRQRKYNKKMREKRKYRSGNLKIGCPWCVKYEVILRKKENNRVYPNFDDSYPVKIAIAVCDYSPDCEQNSQSQVFLRSRSGKYAKSADSTALCDLCLHQLNHRRLKSAKIKETLSRIFPVHKIVTSSSIF